MRKYQEVICTAFFSFVSTGKHSIATDKTMFCKDGVIFSFATPIAFWHGKKLIVTDKKYSKTTSSQQGAILQYAKKYNVEVLHTDAEIEELQEYKAR